MVPNKTIRLHKPVMSSFFFLVLFFSLNGHARRYDEEVLNEDSLSHISTLQFHPNEISALPIWVGKCKGLKNIYLDSNPKLEWREVFEILSALDSLEFVSLRNNALSNLPNNIGKLLSVKSMNLDNNNIIDFPPEIAGLRNTKSLSLERNSISSLNMGLLISYLPHLEQLIIGSNEIDSIPLQLCQSNIRFLYLNGNKLKTLPNCIYKMSNLKYLVLSNNFYEHEKYRNELDVSKVRKGFKSNGRNVIVE